MEKQKSMLDIAREEGYQVGYENGSHIKNAYVEHVEYEGYLKGMRDSEEDQPQQIRWIAIGTIIGVIIVELIRQGWQ